MTPNRRIILNIAATYGRSLYTLAIGLFCGRWTLMLLGEVDYGLMGLVGGLVAFVAFFNTVLNNAVARFYAYAVGQAQIRGNESEGIAECRRWFTVAVSLHTVLAVALLAIGYPLGAWAIENYLVIPPVRVDACIWVWRFVCAACFTTMVCVPLSAMYYAKQYIAELTIYSFITSTLNVIALYYMLCHPRDWFVLFMFWTNCLAIIPRLTIAARAVFLFRECRLAKGYFFHAAYVKKLLGYCFWNFFNTLGQLLRNAGTAVLVNKALGPAKNASVTIANTAAGHAATLSGSFTGALLPAITSSMGANDRGRLVKLINSVCKFGALLVVPFVVPLILEIDEVMVLWLKNPPAGASGLCVLVLLTIVLDKMTTGHWAGIAAKGDIAMYQTVSGCLFALALPISWVTMKCGFGVLSVGISFLVVYIMVVGLRLFSLKKLLSIGPRYWTGRICIPIALTMAIASLAGACPRFLLSQGVVRLCAVTLAVEIVLLPMAWFAVLDSDERGFFLSRLKGLRSRISHFV